MRYFFAAILILALALSCAGGDKNMEKRTHGDNHVAVGFNKPPTDEAVEELLGPHNKTGHFVREILSNDELHLMIIRLRKRIEKLEAQQFENENKFKLLKEQGYWK